MSVDQLKDLHNRIISERQIKSEIKSKCCICGREFSVWTRAWSTETCNKCDSVTRVNRHTDPETPYVPHSGSLPYEILKTLPADWLYPAVIKNSIPRDKKHRWTY